MAQPRLGVTLPDQQWPCTFGETAETKHAAKTGFFRGSRFWTPTTQSSSVCLVQEAALRMASMGGALHPYGHLLRSGTCFFFMELRKGNLTLNKPGQVWPLLLVERWSILLLDEPKMERTTRRLREQQQQQEGKMRKRARSRTRPHCRRLKTSFSVGNPEAPSPRSDGRRPRRSGKDL